MSRKITGLLRWQPDTPARWREPEHVAWLIRESVSAWLTQFENAASAGRECPFEYGDEHKIWAKVDEHEGATPVYKVEVFTEITAPEWVRMMRQPALAAALFREVLDTTTGAVTHFQKTYRIPKNSPASGWESELES